MWIPVEEAADTEAAADIEDGKEQPRHLALRAGAASVVVASAAAAAAAAAVGPASLNLLFPLVSSYRAGNLLLEFNLQLASEQMPRGEAKVGSRSEENCATEKVIHVAIIYYYIFYKYDNEFSDSKFG
eukprot:jgi/Bigna1/146560/aug1.117_g21268